MVGVSVGDTEDHGKDEESCHQEREAQRSVLPNGRGVTGSFLRLATTLCTVMTIILGSFTAKKNTILKPTSFRGLRGCAI
ncbi:hypothetical protein GCM10011574_05560 [Microbispora bryophytorum]|uniref:Uncharacterized protein n=1 Tax=Microbispora bryophytorum TaxID=1460882 RepID=A0A8H9GUK8_9ACTN|nr:hypothetical protein GCM10011574_05560 [Microbispora bryophytorum]